MRRELERIAIPGADEAEARAWEVVSRAHAEREARPERRRSGAILVAVAVGALAVLVAVAVSPAGSAIVHSVREAVGVKRAALALTRLPAPGRLLVTSAEGPWVVQANGSKRLLGPYREASWSPHGLFVAVTRPHELLAVDPHGTVRWSLARDRVALPRWAPDGYRIAYLDGRELRVVNGDGTGDHAIAPAAHVAPAWRPGAAHEHVLAFVTAAGSLELVDVDGAVLVRRQLPKGLRELFWSADGERLAALSAGAASIFDRTGRPLRTIHLHRPVTAAFAPHGHVLAVLTGGRRSYALAFHVDSRVGPGQVLPGQVLFSGRGMLDGLAWSPDGRWLLLSWPSADQWVFVGTRGTIAIRGISAIRTQFDPRRTGRRFPALAGWCC